MSTPIKINLNDAKSICTLNEITLKLFDIVDYKSAIEEIKLSTGKILEFRNVEGFVWMNMQDMTDQNNEKEWISCLHWYNNYKLRTSPTPKQNDTSIKPTNNKKHIF